MALWREAKTQTGLFLLAALLEPFLLLTQMMKETKEQSRLVSYCFQYRIPMEMKKVNKQCLLDTPRTVRVSEKTWQVIVQTIRP